MQTGEWVGTFWRFLWYIGVGSLVSSIAALAVRIWLPESFHMPLFILGAHSVYQGDADVADSVCRHSQNWPNLT